MAIRYSMVSNMSCQIASRYVISCERSQLRGHAETLAEAYEAGTTIARRAIDQRSTKKAVVYIHGTNDDQTRPLVAKIEFEQYVTTHSTWNEPDE